MRYLSYSLIFSAFMLMLGGCHFLPSLFMKERDSSKKPDLSEAMFDTSYEKDMILLDVITIRVPFEKRELLCELWNNTDEQIVSPELRKKLAENGLRFGVQGVAMSNSLARLLPSSHEKSENGSMPSSPQANSPMEVRTETADLNKEPIATRRTLNIMPARRAELRARDDPIKELHLFEYDKFGSPGGKTYQNAFGSIAMIANHQSDGTVLFELTPELKFGETKVDFGYDEYGKPQRFEYKPSRVFDELKVSKAILPGHWLIIGPASENTIGLGKYFFTRNRGEMEQKIIIVRLARTRDDGFFKDSFQIIEE